MSLALDRLSLLADPALRSDPAYLGHMLNDGAYSRVKVEAAGA